ncbi:proteolipid protein 2-like [Antedon mediterranea]|uniref:proteolipid protein 2-like n=1 Tax=Antedon mediterranea TaxID=105859 RepID=UPI003AF5B255
MADLDGWNTNPNPVREEKNDSNMDTEGCTFDTEYVKSIRGILKLKEMGWSILIFILVCVGAATGVKGGFMIFVSISVLICTLIVFMMFLTHLHVKHKLFNMDWYLMDVLLSISATLLYFIASLTVIISPLKPVMIVAGVFGFIAMVVYGGGTYFAWIKWQDSKKRTRAPDYNPEY